MMKYSMLALLLVGCGREEIRIDHEERTPTPVSASAVVSQDLFNIAYDIAAVVSSYGYPVENFKQHAEYLIDDITVNYIEDNKGYPRGSILATALCADYTKYCKSIFRQYAVDSVSMRQTVYHETLHILGFGHEDCEIGACAGIMGAYLDSARDDTTPASITADYLKTLPYSRPLQPGDNK
jgi:hypothetical protein